MKNGYAHLKEFFFLDISIVMEKSKNMYSVMKMLMFIVDAFISQLYTLGLRIQALYVVQTFSTV